MEMWRLYRHENWTQRKIAEHLGIDQSVVSRTLKRMERPVDAGERLALGQQMKDDIDWLRSEMIRLAELKPVPLYSNGRPVLDAEGNVVEDYSYRVRAMEGILKVQKRLAELIGTDAPAKIEATVDVREAEAATSAAAEAVARMAEREAEG